jgi:hypothetical protein
MKFYGLLLYLCGAGDGDKACFSLLQGYPYYILCIERVAVKKWMYASFERCRNILRRNHGNNSSSNINSNSNSNCNIATCKYLPLFSLSLISLSLSLFQP